MKIGFDFRMGGSINAGIGRYSFELLQAMLKQNQTDKFVVFYHAYNCSQKDIETLRDLGAELIEANYRHYSLAEQWRFPKLLKQHDLDLMHFPNFNVPVLYKGRYVVTIHDMVHHKLSGHKRSRYYKFLAYKFIIKKAAQRAWKIITVTEAAKKEIIKYLSTEPHKIVVIHEAAEPKAKQYYDFDKLKDYLLIDKPYLLFFGTLERKKNIIKLAQGFDRFLSKYGYDIDLIIAGKEDPHYPEIRQQALKIKHPQNLIFTGYLEDDKQATLYKHAYAFITASLHEGFGLPGLEAMQYGLPVLAANTEVFNEVYDNGAIYFDGTSADDIAEKINLLVSDQKFHKEMQKKSFERASSFSWDKTAKSTLEVYHGGGTAQEFKPESEFND